jgi:hypothetical protein
VPHTTTAKELKMSDEKGTKSAKYNQETRKLSYIRWKKGKGKKLSDAEQAALDAHESKPKRAAKPKGKKAEAVAKLKAMSKTQVKNTKLEELTALAVAAGIVDKGDTPTKKVLEEAIAKLNTPETASE